MRKMLREFISEKFICSITGNIDTVIEDIEQNSKQIQNANTLFIAKQGINESGEHFVDEAISRGAQAILVSENFFSTKYAKVDVTIVKIFDLEKNIGTIVSEFFDNPSQKLKIIAVTGTCGKTSVACLGQQLFNLLGKKTGLISSISIDDGVKKIPSHMTTPGMIALQKYFYSMLENGLEFCFMEASSHALDQGRLSGTKIFNSIYTNISNNEHLDYHKTFENYFLAKKQLFINLDKDTNIVYNGDDDLGEKIVVNSIAKKFSFGMNDDADFRFSWKNNFGGLEISFDGKNFIKTKLLGESSAYNLAAVYSIGCVCEIKGRKDIEIALSQLEPVVGRLQVFNCQGVNVIVDYAHKVGAMDSVLQDVKTFCKRKIITVFGCGGNRDKSKRPIMTELACKYSDVVVVTTDNIRTEGFKDIVNDMVKDLSEENFRKVSIIFSRRKAIEFALNSAKVDDFVVILGKGHEDTQIIDDKVFQLSDIDIVENFIKDA